MEKSKNNNTDASARRNNCFFLKNGPTPASIRLFLVFSNKHYKFLQQIDVKKCPSSIRCQDLNPRPLERESLPITTRPGLPFVTRLANGWPPKLRGFVCAYHPGGPGFESQAHHLCFFQFVLLKLYRENNENKQKEARIGPFLQKKRKKEWHTNFQLRKEIAYSALHIECTESFSSYIITLCKYTHSFKRINYRLP